MKLYELVVALLGFVIALIAAVAFVMWMFEENFGVGP